MSKGRYNSQQSIQRRRKVALVNREVQLKRWNGSLTGDITGERKDFIEAKIALATTEITTLKSRVGSSHV